MILITTPSGLIGHQVLENLVDSDEQLRVIARDPSALTADERDRVDVIEGSHGDAAVVDEAFAGADAVFWLAPPDPRAPSVEAAFVGFTRPAAEAFKKHGVGRVVGISALGRGTPWASRAGYVAGSLAMDDLIASTGVDYRALTNPSFMDNIVRQAEAIKNQGMFFSPIAGDRKLPAVATRDTAATASRLLLDKSWSGVEEVPLLGPEDLSFNDMAEIISEVVGKEVRFQQTTFEAYKDRFVGVRDVRGDGSGHDRHGLGKERRPRQRRPADARELDADELPPVVRRGAQASHPRSDGGDRVLRSPANDRKSRAFPKLARTNRKPPRTDTAPTGER